MDTPAGVPCWHIHHDTLLEWNTEPLLEREKYIREFKPKSEHETRLRLMRPVAGELPKTVVAAGEKYFAARKKCDAAGEKYSAARKKCDAAGEKYSASWKKCDAALKARKAEIEALHAKECPNCPWNGRTIFP